MHDDQSRSRGQGGAVPGSTPGPSSVISSDGVDAARAYVAPTELRQVKQGQVDAPKVKIADPRRSATVKISRVQADAMRQAAEERPGVTAPMDRPAGAFQPVAVDPALAQEWAQRKAQASSKDAAVTQKIPKPERAAQAAAAAPGTEPLRALPEGEIVDEKEEERRRAEEEARAAKERQKAGRGVWLPVIVTVALGLGIGLVVIKYFLLPPAVPKGTESSASAVLSAEPVPSTPSSVEPVVAQEEDASVSAEEPDAQAPIEITLEEPDAGAVMSPAGRPWGTARPFGTGTAKATSTASAPPPPPPPPTTTSTGVIF